jgi:hypothetical protein
MEFRLIYEGPLRSEPSSASSGPAGRAADKHALRKHFHLQLRQLWNDHPELRSQRDSRYAVDFTPSNMVSAPGPNVRQIHKIDPTSNYPGAKSWVEHIADDHQRCGGRFVLLVSKAGGYVCALSILFLRRDNPGSLVRFFAVSCG